MFQISPVSPVLAVAVVVSLALPAVARAAGTSSKAPPATRRGDDSSTYHGVAVPDPYRWLEDGSSPEVKSWIDAQNAFTESVLGGYPEGAAIAARVSELSLTSTQRSSPQIVAGQLFYLRQTPPQPHAVLVAQSWPEGEARVLVDPNPAPAAGSGGEAAGGTAITGYWPSPDGARIAYGTAEGGTEATTLRVVDVATGETHPDRVPNAGGGTTPQALVWDGDGQGFTYVRLPAPGTVPDDQLQFGAVLAHHVLGRPAGSDAVVFGSGLSPIAEYVLMGSRSGVAAALMHAGDGAADTVYLRGHDGTWREVLGTDAGVHAADTDDGVAWDGDRLLVVAYGGAPRGRILAVAADGSVRPLVAEQDWAVRAVAPIAGGFLAVRVSGPDWRVDQYDADGGLVRSLALPGTGVGIDAIASSADSDVALVAWSGWTSPTRWSRFDGATGALETIFEVRPAADYSAIRSYRLTAVSKDGTRVPVTVLARAGTRPDGERPTILYGYGGFGIPERPAFLGSYLAWLEHGGVYAVVNLRGGSEFGEGWHRAGELESKQNVFDDFFAAARALEEAGWTDTGHLGILGGSNGGLLMGAELTQHPKAFRAVVSAVGIYDMLRVELWPNGRYNVSEYGTVDEARDFEWLHAYSPLHHVEAGTAYPAVLLITGENDPRVAPWQSRKFAAALQSASSSGRPVLLLTRRNEGHGVTASFSQRVGNRAATLTFFAHQLGLPVGVAN
jgi:prolyl oligopeptidase